MTFPPAERVAIGLSAVAKVGMSSAQPFGSSTPADISIAGQYTQW